MNPLSLILFWGSFASAIFFSYRVIKAIKTHSKFRSALINLRDEIATAEAQDDERYRTVIPKSGLYDDELWHACELLKVLEQRAANLRSWKLRARLTKAWSEDGTEIARRACSAIRSLQQSAFWAQFDPESELLQRLSDNLLS